MHPSCDAQHDTGIVGSLSTAIFASSSVNPKAANGLVNGGYDLLYIQPTGVAVAVAWSVVSTKRDTIHQILTECGCVHAVLDDDILYCSEVHGAFEGQ